MQRGGAARGRRVLPPDGTLETFDLHGIALYDGDVEAAGLPEPEYKYSMAGVLKNASDGALRPPDEPSRAALRALLEALAVRTRRLGRA